MALTTFTPNLSVRTSGAIPVFLDAKCTQRAQVFDTSGRPLPGNMVVANDQGIPAAFQVNAATVYLQHASGVVVAHPASGSPSVASGGGPNVALVTHVTGV